MSLVGVKRPQYGQGKRPPVRSKRVTAPKKEWVSTINDLSVHKASPEELSRRREIHRSQNKAVAQWELREKALRRSRRKNQPASPPALDQVRLNIIREVFSDQFQMQDVLARSDRAMAVVKDLFGDAPRRQTGFPSVTMAPDCGSDPELPVLQRPEPSTQLSLLSQSMMDSQALNELEDSEEEYSDEEHDPSISFSSNNGRFRGRSRKGKPHHQSSGPQQQSPPQTPCNPGVTGDQAALNATVAVQRLRSQQSQSESSQPCTLVTQVLNPDPAPTHSGRKSRSSRPSRGRRAEVSGLTGSGLSSLSGNQSSLELLQDMLGQVEAELDSLGPPELLSGTAGPQHRARGLTGFSVALVSTLGRLARHLRLREEEAQREARERKRLEEEVKEQRELIDALTAESLALREESAALQAGLQERMADLEQRLDTVVLALGGMGTLGGERGSEPQGSVAPSCELGPSHAERDTQEHGSVCPAVLLSPPRQRDSRAPAAALQPWSLRYEGSQATGSHASRDDPGTPSSPSSFASLPRPAPPLDEPSQDAVVEQIAELTRQNAAIRAQLGQYRASPAGASVAREQSADRASTASSSEKRVSPPPGQQHTLQTVPCDGSSVARVEQRLLELNRASAAARSKLLELIEQQRQSTCSRASPSISPIPPHPASPHTAVGRMTPEACVLIPERDPSPLANGSGRRSIGGVSPQSLNGGENRSLRAPVEKLKGEGWFSLSAHVR